MKDKIETLQEKVNQLTRSQQFTCQLEEFQQISELLKEGFLGAVSANFSVMRGGFEFDPVEYRKAADFYLDIGCEMIALGCYNNAIDLEKLTKSETCIKY